MKLCVAHASMVDFYVASFSQAESMQTHDLDYDTNGVQAHDSDYDTNNDT